VALCQNRQISALLYDAYGALCFEQKNWNHSKIDGGCDLALVEILRLGEAFVRAVV
jgi:hypothetical protein